jgi:4-carboxymuconolactone decarboxylase
LADRRSICLGRRRAPLGTRAASPAARRAEPRWVSLGLYDRAVKALGHVGITDVITLMGYYTSVSMTLAFYDVPAGAPGMAR